MDDILKTKPISFSSLNLFEYSPLMYKRHVLKQLEEEDTDYFRKGSAFDCLITEPESFDERFAVSHIPPPGGMMEVFVETYLKEMADTGDVARAMNIAYKESGFKLKFPVVEKKFNDPDLQNYVIFRLNNKDKTILSQDEFDQAKGMEQLLKSDVRCRKYLPEKDNPLQEAYNQIKIEWQMLVHDGITEVDALSILDKIVVDHVVKTIQVVDLKTTGRSVFNFPLSFVKYAYYRQAAFYYDAAHQWAMSTNFARHEGYKILFPIFIVIETTCNHLPIIYQTTENDINVGRWGGTLKSGREVKGYISLTESLLKHRENNIWELPMDIYEKGYADLDVFEPIESPN